MAMTLAAWTAVPWRAAAERSNGMSGERAQLPQSRMWSMSRFIDRGTVMVTDRTTDRQTATGVECPIVEGEA